MIPKTFKLNLRERPFKTIVAGTKKVEIRPNKYIFEGDSVNVMRAGDTIIFTSEVTLEKISCEIERITLYKTVRELLQTEGTTQTLSSTSDIEEGIRSIESFPNYKELIEENGVFAIRLGEVKKI